MSLQNPPVISLSGTSGIFLADGPFLYAFAIEELFFLLQADSALSA